MSMASYTLYNGDTYSITFTPAKSSYWSPEISGTIRLTDISTDDINTTYYVYTKPTATIYNSSPRFIYGQSNSYRYESYDNWIKIVVPDVGGEFDIDIGYYCETYNANESYFPIVDIDKSRSVNSGSTTHLGSGLLIDGVSDSVIGIHITATINISYGNST